MHFFCLPVDLRTEIGCYGTNLGIFLLVVLIAQVRIFHLAFSTLSLKEGLPSLLQPKQRWSLLRLALALLPMHLLGALEPPEARLGLGAS